MIEKKSIEIDGTKIFYLDAGPDDSSRIAPTVLLVHGFLVSSSSWADVIPGLSEKFRVVAPDLPGHGDSGIWENMQVSFTRLASFLYTFCDRLGIKSAAIVGHSMGGGISIVAAGMYSQLFTKAVFMDAIAYTIKLPFKSRIVTKAGIGPLIFKKLYGWGMFRSYFKNDVFFDKSKIDEQRLKVYYESFDRPGARDFLYNALKVISHPSEVESKVPEVSVPTLIVWGGNDTLIPISSGHRLVKEIKGSRIEIIPDCGHPPQEEAPGRTLEILLNFLQ
ncbi:MAG: alpha/beta hydrolase [Pseudomonadota bacterium]